MLGVIGTSNAEKYPDQSIIVVRIKDYVYCVSFIKDGSIIFLKQFFLVEKLKKDFQEIKQMNNLDFDRMTIDELTGTLELDQEERELLASIENDEWVSIPNEKEEMKRLQEMARN